MSATTGTTTEPAAESKEGPAAEPVTDTAADAAAVSVTDAAATGTAPAEPDPTGPGAAVPAVAHTGTRAGLLSGVTRVLAPVLSALGRALTRSAAILVLLAVWEAAPRLALVDRTFLPPVSEVAVAWWELLADGELTENIGASLTRSLTGFALAVLVAVPLGLLIGWYRRAADLLSPLLEVFRNTAALALLPVFVLLLGIGETSKISIVLFACTWPVLLNTISAVRTVDPALIRLARSMDLPPLKIFQKVILPASVPTVFTGIRLAGGVAILVLVAAEMVGAKAGLGFLINNSQFNFAIPQMYAGIVTISAIGVVFNQLLVLLEKRFTSWRPAGTA